MTRPVLASTEAPEAGPLGQAERVEQLVRKHFGFVWRVARRWGLDPVDADDAAQQAMLIAAARLADLRPGSERAFLFKTVLHVSNKLSRSRRRRREEPREDAREHADDAPNPEQLLEQRRAREHLDRVLRRLPDPLRFVFILFEIEGLTQVETALALGVPQGTVASRIRRAREEFTRQLFREGKPGAKHDRAQALARR